MIRNLPVMWLMLFATMVGATLAGITHPGPAKAQSIPQATQPGMAAPSVKKFSYIGADNQKVIVTSWVEDGVKCTSTTIGDTWTNKNVSISTSCVKL